MGKLDGIKRNVQTRCRQTWKGTRTRTQEQNYRKWQARTEEKQVAHAKVSELTEELFQAELRGDHTKAAKIRKQLAIAANVPQNVAQRDADFKRDREDRELFLAGYVGYSNEEAHEVYEEIVNCDEMNAARKDIDQGVQNFLKRVAGIRNGYVA